MKHLRKSLISLTKTDHAQSWVEGEGEKDQEAPGVENRVRSISDAGLRIRKPGNSKTNVKYESDDGEIQSVMGGF